MSRVLERAVTQRLAETGEDSGFSKNYVRRIAPHMDVTLLGAAAVAAAIGAVGWVLSNLISNGKKGRWGSFMVTDLALLKHLQEGQASPIKGPLSVSQILLERRKLFANSDLRV